jgi:hypothetical protein
MIIDEVIQKIITLDELNNLQMTKWNEEKLPLI